MKLLRRRSGWVLPIAIAIAIGLAAGAAAFWSGRGTGTATTAVPNIQELTLTPGIVTSQLFPGGDTGVSVIATNANSTFIQIGSIALDTSVAEPIQADAAHSGCNVSSLAFVTQNGAGVGWSVPPRSGTTDGTLTINLESALTMSNVAATACQGATFTVRIKALP